MGLFCSVNFLLFPAYLTLLKYLFLGVNFFFPFSGPLNNPGLPYLRRVDPIKGETGQLLTTISILSFPNSDLYWKHCLKIPVLPPFKYFLIEVLIIPVEKSEVLNDL